MVEFYVEQICMKLFKTYNVIIEVVKLLTLFLFAICYMTK